MIESPHGNASEPTRLLLVEDHLETLNLLRLLLSRAGFAVTIASNVGAAITKLDATPFDILVSDIGLPDGTGFDVIRAFRATTNAPAIALSGYGTADDIKKGFDAGFTHYLV